MEGTERGIEGVVAATGEVGFRVIPVEVPIVVRFSLDQAYRILTLINDQLVWTDANRGEGEPNSPEYEVWLEKARNLAELQEVMARAINAAKART